MSEEEEEEEDESSIKSRLNKRRKVANAQYGIRKQHEIFVSHFCFDFYFIEFTLFRKMTNENFMLFPAY